MFHSQTSIRDSLVPYIRELSDHQLLEQLAKLKKTQKIINTENIILESFLQKNDPKLLEGMQQILEQAQKLPIHRPSSGSSMSIVGHIKPIRSTGSIHSNPSKLSRVSGVDYVLKRINLYTKIDLLAKEKEYILRTMEKYNNSSRIKRANLKAEIEETGMRINEFREAREIFENTIDKETEAFLLKKKFMRFMEEWLKGADSIIEKLRLRTCTMRYKYRNLQSQLKQKEELGESVCPVDIEQLQIEHRVLTLKLEQKTNDLLEMKKKTGEANLFLSKHKRTLQSQMKQLETLDAKTKERQQKMVFLKKEIENVTMEVETSADKLKYMEYLIDNYTVPDLLEYVLNKTEVFALKRNIKIWRRRNNIQENALKTCTKTMKQLTGRKIEDPNWFIIKPKKDKDVDDDLEEEDRKSVV